MSFEITLKALLLNGLMLFATNTSHSSEIDYYAKFTMNLEDSSEQLNNYTNELISDAVNEANKNASCSSERLFNSMSKKLSRPLISQVESHVVNNSDIYSQERQRVNESSFKGFLLLQVIDILPVGRLGSLIRVGDIYLGTDKLGHFHTEGYQYFKKYYQDGTPLKEVLQWGERSERTYFGGYTTGVYSWGDLSANLNGMRFFANLIPGYEDPLGINHESMIHCENNEWVVRRNFDWKEYVDQTFDESINCNSFSRKELLVKYLANQDNQSLTQGVELTCSPTMEQADLLRKKYKGILPYIFNPSLKNNTV